MPLCYVFATASVDPLTTPIAKALRDKRRDVKEVADEIFPRLKGASFTRLHLCALLVGEFQFLIKFQYASLDAVSSVILINRLKHSQSLSRTLTMLQYPGSDRIEIALDDEPFENPKRRWLLLVQERIMGGPGGASNLKRLVEDRLPVRECIEVFGPYDYVVEFDMPVVKRSAVKARNQIDILLKPLTVRCTWLQCFPYSEQNGSWKLYP